MSLISGTVWQQKEVNLNSGADGKKPSDKISSKSTENEDQTTHSASGNQSNHTATKSNGNAGDVQNRKQEMITETDKFSQNDTDGDTDDEFDFASLAFAPLLAVKLSNKNKSRDQDLESSNRVDGKRALVRSHDGHQKTAYGYVIKSRKQFNRRRNAPATKESVVADSRSPNSKTLIRRPASDSAPKQQHPFPATSRPVPSLDSLRANLQRATPMTAPTIDRHPVEQIPKPSRSGADGDKDVDKQQSVTSFSTQVTSPQQGTEGIATVISHVAPHPPRFPPHQKPRSVKNVSVGHRLPQIVKEPKSGHQIALPATNSALRDQQRNSSYCLKEATSKTIGTPAQNVMSSTKNTQIGDKCGGFKPSRQINTVLDKTSQTSPCYYSQKPFPRRFISESHYVNPKSSPVARRDQPPSMNPHLQMQSQIYAPFHGNEQHSPATLTRPMVMQYRVPPNQYISSQNQSDGNSHQLFSSIQTSRDKTYENTDSQFSTSHQQRILQDPKHITYDTGYSHAFRIPLRLPESNNPNTVHAFKAPLVYRPQFSASHQQRVLQDPKHITHDTSYSHAFRIPLRLPASNNPNTVHVFKAPLVYRPRPTFQPPSLLHGLPQSKYQNSVQGNVAHVSSPYQRSFLTTSYKPQQMNCETGNHTQGDLRIHRSRISSGAQLNSNNDNRFCTHPTTGNMEASKVSQKCQRVKVTEANDNREKVTNSMDPKLPFLSHFSESRTSESTSPVSSLQTCNMETSEVSLNTVTEVYKPTNTQKATNTMDPKSTFSPHSSESKNSQSGLSPRPPMHSSSSRSTQWVPEAKTLQSRSVSVRNGNKDVAGMDVSVKSSTDNGVYTMTPTPPSSTSSTSIQPSERLGNDIVAPSDKHTHKSNKNKSKSTNTNDKMKTPGQAKKLHSAKGLPKVEKMNRSDVQKTTTAASNPVQKQDIKKTAQTAEATKVYLKSETNNEQCKVDKKKQQHDNRSLISNISGKDHKGRSAENASEFDVDEKESKLKFTQQVAPLFKKALKMLQTQRRILSKPGDITPGPVPAVEQSDKLSKSTKKTPSASSLGCSSSNLDKTKPIKKSKLKAKRHIKKGKKHFVSMSVNKKSQDVIDLTKDESNKHGKQPSAKKKTKEGQTKTKADGWLVEDEDEYEVDSTVHYYIRKDSDICSSKRVTRATSIGDDEPLSSEVNAEHDQTKDDTLLKDKSHAETYTSATIKKGTKGKACKRRKLHSRQKNKVGHGVIVQQEGHDSVNSSKESDTPKMEKKERTSFGRRMTSASLSAIAWEECREATLQQWRQRAAEEGISHEQIEGIIAIGKPDAPIDRRNVPPDFQELLVKTWQDVIVRSTQNIEKVKKNKATRSKLGGTNDTANAASTPIVPQVPVESKEPTAGTEHCSQVDSAGGKEGLIANNSSVPSDHCSYDNIAQSRFDIFVKNVIENAERECDLVVSDEEQASCQDWQSWEREISAEQNLENESYLCNIKESNDAINTDSADDEVSKVTSSMRQSEEAQRKQEEEAISKISRNSFSDSYEAESSISPLKIAETHYVSDDDVFANNPIEYHVQWHLDEDAEGNDVHNGELIYEDDQQWIGEIQTETMEGDDDDPEYCDVDQACV